MLVPSEHAHIPQLAERMREMDRLECAACGMEPLEALDDALRRSVWSLTAVFDDGAHAMMGVASKSMIEGVGVPWMLASDRVYDSARELVTYGPAIMGEMTRSFSRLENVVSAANDRAISFLRHWGWRILSETVDIGGVQFVRFSNV